MTKGRIFASIGILVLIIQLYLFLRADFIYGKDAQAVQWQILSIIVMQTALHAQLDKKLPTLSTGIKDLWKFSVVFLASAFVFSFIPTQTVQGLLGSAVLTTIGYGLLHAFVIAYGEEISFRALLPDFVGIPASIVLFGAFHYGITGYTLGAVIVLTVGLAIPAMILQRKLGVLAAVGYHFAWNMKALGVLDVMIQSLIRGGG